MSYYWMSFCDQALPHGERFLGVCIFEGYDSVSAYRKLEESGIDPGGDDILITEFQDFSDIEELDGKEMELGRLYTRAELYSLGFITVGEQEAEVLGLCQGVQ